MSNICAHFPFWCSSPTPSTPDCRPPSPPCLRNPKTNWNGPAHPIGGRRPSSRPFPLLSSFAGHSSLLLSSPVGHLSQPAAFSLSLQSPIKMTVFRRSLRLPLTVSLLPLLLLLLFHSVRPQLYGAGCPIMLNSAGGNPMLAAQNQFPGFPSPSFGGGGCPMNGAGTFMPQTGGEMNVNSNGFVGGNFPMANNNNNGFPTQGSMGGSSCCGGGSPCCGTDGTNGQFGTGNVVNMGGGMDLLNGMGTAGSQFFGRRRRR